MGKHVVLCPNPYRDIGLSYTKRAKQLLEESGHEVVVSMIYGTDKENPVFPLDINPVPLEHSLSGAGLLVSFGGDGTILHTARAATHTRVPIIGVNLGSKGFMAELEPFELERLSHAAAGLYTPENRMMLDVKLVRAGRDVYTECALNDAVVHGVVNVIRIEALGDGRTISNFSGDGVIVATPTGSTAYSMAAGGPLVEPSASNIILTPVCSHALMARSFVLAPERAVTLRLGELGGKQAILSVDGTDSVNLESWDEVQICRSENQTLLAHVGHKSFYDIAFEKLGERK